MGGPKGTVKAGLRTVRPERSGGPEPEAYLKRSDREEPASSGSPRGVPRGVGAGGEISRAAMVSRGRGRPRSCARGAANGAGRGSNDDDHAAGASLSEGSGEHGADAPPRSGIAPPNTRTATLLALPSAWPMMTVGVSGLARMEVEPSTMSMTVIRLPPSFAARLPPREDEMDMSR